MKLHHTYSVGMRITLCLVSLLAAASAFSAPRKMPIISDPVLLKKAGIPWIMDHPELGVALAELTPEQEIKLSHAAHMEGRCGGFEALPHLSLTEAKGQFAQTTRVLTAREQINSKNLSVKAGLVKRPEIELAAAQVREGDLETHVKWLSSFPSRKHNQTDPNVHVNQLQTRLTEMTANSKTKVSYDQITHTNTRQKTLRATITGTTRPTEIIALGAHLDSITGFMGGPIAPGADDDASGSANLIEILRILADQPAPERTVEFFWYAGEEGGLLGSAQIASSYKAAKKDVVAVLQLDMTLFAGSGEFVISPIMDFTSAWLNGVLRELNTHYTQAKIVESRCGYGCSDHASWTRSGFPAVMPHEATFRDSNKKIHTAQDVVDARSNFKHAAVFSKLGVAFAMELANSTIRESI